MKKLKKMVSMLMVTALCVLLPNTNTLTVSAEEPVTYYVKHLDNQWRFQPNATWDANVQHRELYYMYQDIKDGDIIIVDGVDTIEKINVSVRLSNLTMLHNSSAVVTAKSIDNCYILGNSVCAVNGDVTNAYVYENGCCTFNNNVKNLSVLNEAGRNNNRLQANVTVMGTVEHLLGHDGTQTHYEFYNFAAGKLVVTEGAVKTDAAYYSTTPSAASNTQTTQNTQSTSSASSDEYDDVPKTGESNLMFWLLGISVVCLAGRYTLKKTA